MTASAGCTRMSPTGWAVATEPWAIVAFKLTAGTSASAETRLLTSGDGASSGLGSRSVNAAES